MFEAYIVYVYGDDRIYQSWKYGVNEYTECDLSWTMTEWACAIITM